MMDRFQLVPLEARTLLSAIHINFQPDLRSSLIEQTISLVTRQSATLPAGYQVDGGKLYGDRGNGYTYGWNRRKLLGGRMTFYSDVDVRYNTSIEMSDTDDWEIGLPSDLYNVHIVGGGDLFAKGKTVSFAAENAMVASEPLSCTDRWAEGTATVAVADGRLTVESRSGSDKICFIDIDSAAPTGLTVTSAANVPRIDLKWQDNAKSEGGYHVYRSDDGVHYLPLAELPANAVSFTDIGVDPGRQYYYRVKAYVGSAESTAIAGSAKAANFRVFNAMAYQNMPSLTGYGVEPVMIDDRRIFEVNGQPGVYNFNVPDEIGTRKVARDAAQRGMTLVIDIERWPTDIRNASPAAVDATMAKFAQIIDWARDEAPNLKLGVYGIMPLRDYWSPVNYLTALQRQDHPWWRAQTPLFEARYRSWQAANQYLHPLASKVDCVFPSIYTFYTDQQSWAMYAKANIEEAKQYGKPVYCFVWMDYHDSNKELGQTPIGGAYWDMELATVRANANGVVIWGGYSKTGDDNADWWQVTQDFLATR